MQTDGRLWLSTGAESEPEFSSEAIVADVLCNPRRRSHGFWAITRHVWDPTLRITSDRLLTTEESDQIRALMADLIDSDQWIGLPEYASLVRSGTGPVTQIVWTGYVHNAASSVLAMAMLWSFGWVRERHVFNRSARRLACGRCPSCDYDLRGETERGCPECGWGRD